MKSSMPRMKSPPATATHRRVPKSSPPALSRRRPRWSTLSQTAENTGQAHQLVSKADVAMQDIVQNITSMAHLMSDIAGSSHEQSDGQAQINSTMNHIDDATQQNAALVEQSAAAASMQEQVRDLMVMVDIFKVDPVAAR